jgi:Ca2+-binding RTX toxin-like protein
VSSEPSDAADRRNRLGAVALALAVIGCAVAVLAGRSEAAPQVELAAAGPIEISNSLEGQAILTVDDLAPGESRSATVTIGNTGSAPGALSLAGSQPLDTPGPNGGALSLALVLEIADVTGGANVPVYAGRLTDLERADLLTLPAGDERTYRFAVTLPDGGVAPTNWSGDNAYQAASTRVDYVWTLTAAETAACGNRLRGTGRADDLVGTLAGDRISGGGAADRIRARGGDDCAGGGRGGDRVDGGSGDDVLSGGAGRDRLSGAGGDDEISTRGHARDVVRCGPGTDEARIDRRDVVRGCEGVKRPRAGA